jgi:ABC-type multidrug transport system ATPase subunit
VVLDRINLTLLPDDRIALLGSNGNGKSTFCKLIGGRLKPMRGEMRASPKLDAAYFAQHQLDELNPNATVFDHVAKRMPDAPVAKVRARAARFGFPGGRADTVVSALSGGEKARLLMGLAAFEGPHLLILDEPTNHLDIDSRAALLDAINDYTGAVILVSHDRFLIEACADQLWLVANGGVKPFDGDMDDYRRLVLSGGLDAPSRAKEPEAARASRTDERRAAAERRVALALCANGSRPWKGASRSSELSSPRSTRRSATARPFSRIPRRRASWPACAQTPPGRLRPPRRSGSACRRDRGRSRLTARVMPAKGGHHSPALLDVAVTALRIPALAEMTGLHFTS